MEKELKLKVLEKGNEKCPVCGQFKLQIRLDDCKADYHCGNCATRFRAE